MDGLDILTVLDHPNYPHTYVFFHTNYINKKKRTYSDFNAYYIHQYLKFTIFFK